MIKPNELANHTGMRHGSLFSGIGGFDLAAQWMGWQNVFQVESNDRCRKLLGELFKESAQYGAIEKFSGSQYRGTIDVLSGGFPCQTFSMAGKGTLDLTLWKEMFRVIREVRPKNVVAENVYGIVARKKGMALSSVYDDLESAGYSRLPPLIIPACAAGAWHRRDRVWIIAHLDSDSEPTKSGDDFSIFRELGEVSPNIKTQGLYAGGLCSGNETQQSKPNYNFRASDWNPWTTEPLVGGRVHGIPDRVDRIAELGNAIYPQVAFEIFKAIEATMI